MSEATREGAEQVMENFLFPEDKEQEETQETEEVEEEVQEIEDESPEEPEEDADESGEPQLELASVAKVLGLSEDDLDLSEDGSVLVKTKVDGKLQTVKLADLRKSYQLEGHLNNKNMEVAEARKKLDEQKAEQEAQVQQRFKQAEDYLSLAHTELMREFNSITPEEWSKLQSEDPIRAVQLKQEFQERQAYINNAWSQLQGQRQQEAEALKAKAQERQQQEMEKLREIYPEWSDPEKFKADASQMRKTLREEYAFSDQEINQLGDHRLVRLVRDAIRTREHEKTKPEVTKKLRAAPKVVKGGTPATPVGKDGKARKAFDKVKKSGSDEDIEAWLDAKGIL